MKVNSRNEIQANLWTTTYNELVEIPQSRRRHRPRHQVFVHRSDGVLQRRLRVQGSVSALHRGDVRELAHEDDSEAAVARGRVGEAAIPRQPDGLPGIV